MRNLAYGYTDCARPMEALGKEIVGNIQGVHGLRSMRTMTLCELADFTNGFVGRSRGVTGDVQADNPT